ncbi:MAG TPA: YraN family protein [Rhodocyclaceae bacterium]
MGGKDSTRAKPSGAANARELSLAAESITPAKIRRIVLATRLYLAALPARFDCVLVDAGAEADVRWLRDAFSAD